MSPPSDMKKPLRRGNGEGAGEAATKHHISDRSLPMDWFKISDTPGTDYTRVTVDVPNEQLADVIDAVRACAPAIDRPGAEGSSSEQGLGVGESAPLADVGRDAAHAPSEEVGGEGAAVIFVAFSVPRGGRRADIRWPAPHIMALPLRELIGETLADLQAALAEEAEGGEAR